MAQLQVNARIISDLEMIATGAHSPLEGFMGEADYSSVVQTMRLANGLPWPIPVTFPVSHEQAARLELGSDAALYNG